MHPPKKKAKCNPILSLFQYWLRWGRGSRSTMGSLSKNDVDGSENVIWNSAIISQLFKLSHYAWKCVLTILQLNWNQRLWDNKTNLNICHQMSSTKLQNSSFHVVERTRTSSKCQKMKNARAKRAKILLFVVKYANLWGFCCRRRRGCLSSLMPLILFFSITDVCLRGKCSTTCRSGRLKVGSCGQLTSRNTC